MKPEVVFGLENAAWPALLVNAGGVVLRANAAATKVFGAALSGDTPLLSAIWSPENGGTADRFSRAVGTVADGDGGFEIPRGERRDGKFTVAICTFNNDDKNGLSCNCCPFVEPVAPPAPVPAVPAPAGNRQAGGSSGRQGGAGAQAKTGLRAATGADGLAGFQQRADQHARPHFAAAGQGGAGASVAAFADGGGKIGGARGGNRQRTRACSAGRKRRRAARRRAI